MAVGLRIYNAAYNSMLIWISLERRSPVSVTINNNKHNGRWNYEEYS